MAVFVTHTTVATGVNDASKQVSKDAWNEGHTVTGLGDAAEKNTGTTAGTVAAGDHLHTGVYEPAGVAAADITDSTATGRAVVTAADAAAARTAIGAGTSSFGGAYADLSGIPSTFAPSAHATSHKSGGSDAIKLDELAAPTDVTTLNASTTAHGLLLKLDGLTTTFLRGDGTWASPGAASTNIKQTEIDFGATPVSEASFVVTDADVSAGSQLLGSVAYEAPTGKDLDELDMDGLDLKFAPGSGELTIYARGLDGYVADKFKINYLIG